jgi:N-acetylneuraminic acid mutarotase
MKHSRLLAALVVGSLVSISLVSASDARPLTFEERVAAQRAIEQVYWNHRLWPKENAVAKPTLPAVLPDATIRARVDDTLRKSNALEKYWHRPVTVAQLQGELNRMASQTRSPDVLRELFTALGSDPQLIAETLARQTLVDRLIRNWYANDERFHGDLKRKAKAAVHACRSIACMPAMGGEYRETTWKVEREGAGDDLGELPHGVVRLDSGGWKEQMERLRAQFGNRAEALPVLKLSTLEETADEFVVTAVLAQGREEVKTATVTWPKISFDRWWSKESGSTGTQAGGVSRGLTLPMIGSPGCARDTWVPIRGAGMRDGHAAVWTGSEMIVWGGNDGGYFGDRLNTGSRYDPSTDSWTPISTAANVPSGRSGHTAVWTGTEVIVWGGLGAYFSSTSTGGRYDPSTDTWTPTSTGANVAVARFGHTAVWTGTEMIVWGGNGTSGLSTPLNTGGRYDPSTDTWSPTSTGANVPAARSGHTAVWTGTEMIVWGGADSSIARLNTGGRYDPSTDIWTSTPTGANVPAARSGHTAVWTGSEMIVWGGASGSSNPLNTGGRYDPSLDTWTPTSTGANLAAPRSGHTAVWTGTEMIVWGSGSNTGGRYHPGTDTWTPTSSGANVPPARSGHTAIWTGTEMIIWGGIDGYSLNTGGRYDPTIDSWIPTATGALGLANVPAPRSRHTSVWTGTEMIIWGGTSANGTYSNTGGRYRPATDTWTPTSTGSNVPAARNAHTAVWTGNEMMIWGGTSVNGTYLNSGGRYSPATDTWMPTSIGVNVALARADHTMVWTGTEVIVWGGTHANGGYSNTGGRYDPSTDTWRPTSIGANVPGARFGHTAVWTGTEMIVWGGGHFLSPFYCDGFLLMDRGGRYNPSTDTWMPTSTAGSLSGRAEHGAVWTGAEMIVWGGISACACDERGYFYCDRSGTGGRYDPSTDTWTPTSQVAIEARSDYTAVWTGSEMIVWGGVDNQCYEGWCCYDGDCMPCLSCDDVSLANGGRYVPSADAWMPLSAAPASPSVSTGHTAVWTGMEMLIWGGAGGLSKDDGSLFCACPDGALFYRDADGDGAGDAAAVASSCDGVAPAGYVADHGDCNDAVAAIHPGVVEVCNGVDDDCNGSMDDAARPAPLASLTLRSDAPVVDWSPVATAQSYDVVYGDIATLRGSGGDFTAATAGCIAAGTTSTTSTFITAPAVGQALWIVARGDNCAGPGTYDSGAPSQIGSRDAGIDASPLSCGFQAVCGDGVCSPTEGCSDCPSDCGACQCATDSDCQPASCCNPTSCIPIWEPQSCDTPTCGDGCWICLTACQCQSGACVAVF